MYYISLDAILVWFPLIVMTVLFIFIFIIVCSQLLLHPLDWLKGQQVSNTFTDEIADFDLLCHSIEAVGPASENHSDAFLHSDWLLHLLPAFHHFHHRTK